MLGSWTRSFSFYTGIFLSVPEMPYSREHHGHAPLVRRGDPSRVPPAAAGLDDRGRARLDHRIDAVAEREEGVGGDRGAGEREPRGLRLERGDARAVHPAH